MAISDNYVPIRQLGNGVTTQFSANWAMLDASYLTVFFEDAVTGIQTPVTTGFTLVFTDSGFTVTFAVAPPNTEYVVIGRTVSLDQTDPYRTAKGYQGEVLEASLDKLTAIDQDLQNQVNRSLKFQLGSLAVGALPVPVDQSSLVWSGTGGTLINGPTVGQISGAAAAAATAVAASATAVAASNQAAINSSNAPVYNCPTVAGTNTIALTTSASVTSYSDGQIFEFTPANNITGAAQANVNTIGAVTILDEAGNALTTGAIVAGVPTAIMKKGANFYLMLDPRTNKGISGNGAFDFRLTLTSGVPVTSSDVTSAASIFLSPFKGSRIALYNGSAWNIRTSAQLSIALGTLVSGTTYDVFVFDNAGVPTLELSAAWSNSTPGSAAIFASGPFATVRPTQDGVYVKSTNGTAIDATRRYVGSFTTTSTTTTEDSRANRHLYNYYNRTDRSMVRQETSASYTYSLAAFRQVNAAIANQLNFTLGVSEDAVTASCRHHSASSTTANATVVSTIGLNSSTAIATDAVTHNNQASNLQLAVLGGDFRGMCPIGANNLVWLERGNGSLVQTWFPVNTAGAGNAGISGIVKA